MIRAPYNIELIIKAVGSATGDQARIMGGAFATSVVTSVFNSYVLPRLASLGIPSSSLIGNLQPSLALLPLELQESIKLILTDVTTDK
jgi:hypothetical protein